MTNFKIYEVMVPEYKDIQFNDLMKRGNFAVRDKKQFRITNLDAFFKNEQKSIGD